MNTPFCFVSCSPLRSFRSIELRSSQETLCDARCRSLSFGVYCQETTGLNVWRTPARDPMRGRKVPYIFVPTPVERLIDASLRYSARAGVNTMPVPAVSTEFSISFW